MLDIWLPGMDGLATLARLRERRVDAPVVMISGHGNIESAVRAIKLGAFDFVEKPLSLEKTVLVVGNAVRQRRLEAENRALRAHVDKRLTMVGESYVMTQLREQVAMAAPTNGRVLIYGENGTGKELVARSIHALSRRRTGPFVEVNCAAIPEELIESELFGHVKGAFTGALPDRRGKFELADGGTLFLDEIGDMSLKTQAKVLRALQEQVVEPVGGASGVRVDVRVLAATNKDLTAEIRGGALPRGSVLPAERHPDLRAAAARSASDDIPLLADHFMSELAREYGRRPKTLDAGATAAAADATAGRATSASCATCIERLMIMVPGDTIAASDLAFLDGTRDRRTRHRTASRCRCTRRANASSAITSCARWRSQQGNISRTADVARRRAQQPVSQDAGVRDRALEARRRRRGNRIDGQGPVTLAVCSPESARR